MYAVIFHAHQKIDRVARHQLKKLLPDDSVFPTAKEIVRFEGQHGPDATRLKNRPGQEQPWHFYSPFDPNDNDLPAIIAEHHRELISALKGTNPARAAFEAAWLAHAIVDGLTPAHHYPYEAELERLRGQGRHTRKTLTSRIMIKGESTRDSLKRSLRLMGPKGLLMNHTTFEGGAYVILKTMSFRGARPTVKDIDEFRQKGLTEYFRDQARHIASLEMYERYMHTGWTPKLGRQVRKVLIPRMIKTVALAWYTAALEVE